MRMSSLQKKIIIAGSAFVVLVLVALAVLIYFSNRIIKAELEKTLGERGRIERIALGWNKVDAFGVDLSKDGQTFFHAKKIQIKASFLTLLGRRYAISDLAMEQPSLVLQIDEKGNVANPLESSREKAKEEEGTAASHPFDLRHVLVSDGSITIRDKRLKGEGPIQLTGIQLRLDNISFPVSDSASKVSLRMVMKGPIVSGTVACNGTINPGTTSGVLTVEAANLEALTDDRGPKVKTASLHFTASMKGQGQTPRNIVFSGVTLTKPFIRVEEDRAGHMLGFLPWKTSEKAKPEKGGISMTFNDIAVTGGEVLYLDGKVARPPYPIRVTDISLTTGAVSLPLTEAWTTWQLSAHIPGKSSTGQLGGAGKTNFHSLDTNGKLTLRSLDMVVLKPYLQKKGEADLKGGTLYLDMDLTIRNKFIHAPTHTVLRNLQFASGGGVKDQFLGIPRSLIVKLLETSKNELPLDFVVQGRVDNPQFNLREDFARRLGVAIGQQLGVNVIGTGEKAVRQGGRVLEGIGKGIGGLFGR